MSPNPLVVMLYVELGMFLAGLGCLTVARFIEVSGEGAHAIRNEVRGAKRAFVLSRLGA